MSFDDNNDPENELPDWLKDLQDDSGVPADSFSNSIDKEDKEGKENQSRKFYSIDNASESFEPASDKKASDYLQGEQEDDDTQEWLKRIQEQQNLVLDDDLIEEPINPSSLLDRIQKLKNEDDASTEENIGNLEQENKKTPPLIFDENNSENDEEDESLDIPDWLKNVERAEPFTEEDNDEVEKTGGWIKKFTSDLDPSVLDLKIDYEFEEDLDWINEQVSAIADSNEINENSISPSDPNLDQVPDWLTEMEENSPEMSEMIISETSIPDLPVEELELTDFKTEELDSEDIPDWLKISDTDEETEKEELQKPVDVEAKDDSKSWIDKLSDKEDDEEVEVETERFGPLFGLKNVLPAEPENILFSPNPHPRSNLFVSKTQKSHISILQSLIADEGQSTRTEKKTLAIPQKSFRWLIASLLYISIFISVFNIKKTTPIPNTTQPEIIAMAEIINSLAPGSPVLVAIEYQPGLSGEMEASSAAVLDHLLDMEAQLAFISTSPTGPGLTEHFLQNRLSTHSYIKNYRYPNFGYISGETAALLKFASDPQGTVPIVSMTDTEGNQLNGWNTEPLNQIQSIDDFAMVLVITDDPTTAISWIEQVQPLMDTTDNTETKIPLTMVLSAQAGPLIYPYYDTEAKQVSAIVSGLYGGVAYEALNHSENIASRYWDGFGIGLSLTISIVLLGGSFSFIQSWRKTRKADNEE